MEWIVFFFYPLSFFVTLPIMVHFALSDISKIMVHYGTMPTYNFINSFKVYTFSYFVNNIIVH